ncbi:hypothetical protein CYMTET_40284 [Cymbomonas tetramitiformis]|uniref:GDT1 family protein n=1 Tax=Cymbomonas tetramitiformis TaxID=36881 RepID=A0AAE0C9L2_9CHLO|nr:hypothetical protein CYMTET_40284 [Cymbomonas tetramitiformis]
MASKILPQKVVIPGVCLRQRCAETQRPTKVLGKTGAQRNTSQFCFRLRSAKSASYRNQTSRVLRNKVGSSSIFAQHQRPKEDAHCLEKLTRPQEFDPLALGAAAFTVATLAAGPASADQISSVAEAGGLQEGFISAFLLIFFSEIGDKTFFIAVLLALKESRSAVFVGTFSALALTGPPEHFCDSCLHTEAAPLKPAHLQPPSYLSHLQTTKPALRTIISLPICSKAWPQESLSTQNTSSILKGRPKALRMINWIASFQILSPAIELHLKLPIPNTDFLKPCPVHHVGILRAPRSAPFPPAPPEQANTPRRQYTRLLAPIDVATPFSAKSIACFSTTPGELSSVPNSGPRAVGLVIRDHIPLPRYLGRSGVET